MEIMLMTPNQTQEKEIDNVIHLFELGLDTLHLSKPKMSTRRMVEYISAIPFHFHNKIIIHSHHDLAFRFSLKGIHFTKHHLERTFRNWCLFQREKIFRKKLIHTRSYSKSSDIFNSEKYKFDYYLLRGVFNRITKDFNIGYHPLRVIEMQKTGKKLVVRGGIDIETAKKAKTANFYGICLNAWIWNSINPIQNFIDIKEVLTV